LTTPHKGQNQSPTSSATLSPATFGQQQPASGFNIDPSLNTPLQPSASTSKDTNMSESGTPHTPAQNKEEGQQEHLNIKVTDSNNEVFFKIKRSTQLSKLMNAFCERQGKNIQSCRFMFDGQRVQQQDTPDTLEMQDGDMLEVFQEQIGGGF